MKEKIEFLYFRIQATFYFCQYAETGFRSGWSFAGQMEEYWKDGWEPKDAVLEELSYWSD